jgi:phosphoribosylformimino-5-aminoimidazole carboxamide ribotide isomerase
MGAPRVHIVDLDGAASGELVNLDIITEMASALLIPAQVGGGIRYLETVEELLKTGVERVILGTSAVKNPALVERVCEKFSESIIVSIDTRGGLVATHGWREQTELGAVEFARSMIDLGVRRFIYTDISRDGTLTEPNFTAVSELVNAIRLPVIAAGGIATLDHLSMLARLGVEGAIVGRALYTGDVNLKQALDVISRTRTGER